jgi:hypothetical protein
MRAPQITDYPEAVEVFEENDCEALFEVNEETNEVILKIKKPGSWNWNITHPYRTNQIPDPTDKDACDKFWQRVWQAYHIYPRYVPTYAIASEATWIPVRERQPDNNQPVLVYGELRGTGRRAHVATYRVGASDYYPSRFEYTTPDILNVSLDDVTHWLPIPDAPRRAQR